MMGTDWMRAKNFPTFFPTGPWLVPAAFVPDLLDLRIQLQANGRDDAGQQHRRMVFGPAELIAYISRFTLLRTGRHDPHRIPTWKRLPLWTFPARRVTRWSARSTGWASSALVASQSPDSEKGPYLETGPLSCVSILDGRSYIEARVGSLNIRVATKSFISLAVPHRSDVSGS